MGQDPREVGAQRLEDDQDKSAEQLRGEIEDTRGELGDTVEALAAKTDVKTRARERADELKRTALAKKEDLVSKAKQASPGGGGPSAAGGSSDDPARTAADGSGGGGASAAVQQLKRTAQENPVPTAAVAAFIGGVAFGRLTSRR